MALKVGAADVQDVKLGATQVTKVMLGAVQVWPVAISGVVGHWEWSTGAPGTEAPGKFVRHATDRTRIYVAYVDANGVDHLPELQQLPTSNIHMQFVKDDGTLADYDVDVLELYPQYNRFKLELQPRFNESLIAGKVYQIHVFA